MLKPYYQDEWTTIYNADCREILPNLSTADLVFADPPYNVGKDYDIHDDAMSQVDYVEFCSLGLWLSLLPKSHLITIRRGASGPFREGWSDQFEIALATGRPSNCVPDLWDGIRLKGEGYFFREETFGHPGYTPLPICEKAISLLSEISIIDPFMGTGTSIVAAKKLGRKSIGIEISEAYCKIAVERLRQSVMNFNLPIPSERGNPELLAPSKGGG